MQDSGAAAGVPIKVASERPDHANPGFTMTTYQHVMPGMGAQAANRFTQLLSATRWTSTEFTVRDACNSRAGETGR